jgi:hypothetical protein
MVTGREPIGAVFRSTSRSIAKRAGLQAVTQLPDP